MENNEESNAYEAQAEKKPDVDWNNVPSLDDLKADYNSAKEYHDDDVDQINENLDFLHTRGKAAFKKKKGRSSLNIKLIRKQAEWRYSALLEPFLSSTDFFDIRPRTASDREGAQLNKILINYQFDNKINRVKFLNDLVHKLVDEGTAVIRVGWNYKENVIQHNMYLS